MLRRTTRGQSIPSYEIETPDWVLRLSPREICQLACEIETWFRDNREQLIEDVCRETELAGEPSPARRSEPAVAPSMRN